MKSEYASIDVWCSEKRRDLIGPYFTDIIHVYSETKKN